MSESEANMNEKANEIWATESLPPPPPLRPDVVPVRVVPTEPEKKVVRVPGPRRGMGTKGQKITLLTNHFKANVANVDQQFVHYSVAMFYEDGRPVEGKRVGRKVLDKVAETYKSELAGMDFAYDGEKSLFTVGALRDNKMKFTVVLEDMSSARNNGNESSDGSPHETEKKRFRRPSRSKTFDVQISYANTIPMQAIANALRGQESANSQEAFRVLDIILRQHAAKQGCLLVRQSFFNNYPKNFVNLGGGVLGCKGFHSSFRTSQGGLSLNTDVSTTTIIQPGPVVEFLMTNQNARDPFCLDWTKAKRTLKNLRITVRPSNQEYKITGLSDRPCKEQTFAMKQRNGNVQGQTVELTVLEYFVNHRNINLHHSGDLPCINVGKPKRPTYIPIELCSLVSLQRYTKALSTLQRSSLVEKSRQKPQERMNTLSYALRTSDYSAEPLFRACGISISTNFTQVDGRILPAPKLKAGNGEYFFPHNGRWNFNKKKLVKPATIESWAIVNFSAGCDVRALVQDLKKCADMRGIPMDSPLNVIEESPQMRGAPAQIRVEKMSEELQSKLYVPKFLLCLLPVKKNSDIYGPWKRKNLVEFGIVTQCIAPPVKVNDQYLTNVLLKINAKLGGLNSLLAVERSPWIPLISDKPTIILGMDVSHGSPGRSDIPSIAAVVSSWQWPLISSYRASVRTQSPKHEMIDSLFKPVSGTNKDEGMMREAFEDFCKSTSGRKPDHVIIFRDGVSESQFNQVLNIELDQIIQACKFLDETWDPKFVVVIAQKNHHTRFFRSGSPDNVPPGTVIDNKVCHPRNNDFYLCAHTGMIGTTRPTHYHVLLDEIGFSADALQELVHSLSYVYQRSTTAISIGNAGQFFWNFEVILLIAPIRYAHLAASQVGQFMKFEELSDTSSSQGGSGTSSSGSVPVPPLPKLANKVANSMFFC